MKHYCIISYCNLYILPYATTYINTIINSGAKCDLLFWDRDAVTGEKDFFPECKKIVYQKKTRARMSRISKFAGYIGATRFIKKRLREVKYDGIVFLQSHGAVMCQSVVMKKYKRRYILDIRDYSLENIPLFFFYEKRLIKHSFANVISSPAYRRFLPKGEYVIAHNYVPFDIEDVKRISCSKKEKTDMPVRISFIGTVRFFDMDKKILNLFANDERFIISYFGRGAEVLEEYCRENDIRNVSFYGSFSPRQTIEFYEKTDIINNLYGNHNKFLDYALSNKLYHAGQLSIPILVCPDTYMEDVTKEYDLGFVFDVENRQDKECLFEWYSSLDQTRFKERCECFINKVRRDNELFYETCLKFVEM